MYHIKKLKILSHLIILKFRSGLSALLAAGLSESLDGLGDWQLNLLITFITTFCTEVIIRFLKFFQKETKENLVISPILLGVH